MTRAPTNSFSVKPCVSFLTLSFPVPHGFSEPDTTDGLEITSNHRLIYPGCSYSLKWLTETGVSVSFISLFSVKGNFPSIFKIGSIHLVVK